MNRGSWPDFDNMMDNNREQSESWLSAFNRVVRGAQGAPNTVSITDMHSRPGIAGIFGEGRNLSSEGHLRIQQQNKTIMCNGHNILALSREDIMSMSLSDAHETLFQLRVEGNMMKKGFKRLRMWKMRFFILSGKILSYWEVDLLCSLHSRLVITIRCVIKQKSL